MNNTILVECMPDIDPDLYALHSPAGDPDADDAWFEAVKLHRALRNASESGPAVNEIVTRQTHGGDDGGEARPGGNSVASYPPAPPVVEQLELVGGGR